MPNPSIKHLVRMANQIAANAPAISDAERAELTATHLRRFWPPALQRRLLNMADTGAPELSPVASEAIARLRRGAATDGSSPD